MKPETMSPRAYWNSVAAEFDAIYSGRKSGVGRLLDRWFRKDMYQRFDWVMERSGEVAGKTVCDIGCGSGRFVAEFARRGAAKVVGVDISRNMLELAANLAREAGVQDGCEFVESDVLGWNPGRRFDITVAIGFWDYIADPLPRLRAIRELSSGVFLSAWPRLWTWRMPVRKVRMQYLRGCPVYFYREPQVRRLLREAGFDIVAVETIGKLHCVKARVRDARGAPTGGSSSPA